MFDYKEVEEDNDCNECEHYNLNSCLPENCPCVVETWERIKEKDLINEKTGLVIRYTMRRTSDGKEKYIYWNELLERLRN